MTSVGEDFPVQQARVHEIRGTALSIGPAGTFLVAMCNHALKEADEAAISGDVVRILRAYTVLKEFKS